MVDVYMLEMVFIVKIKREQRACLFALRNGFGCGRCTAGVSVRVGRSFDRCVGSVDHGAASTVHNYQGLWPEMH